MRILFVSNFYPPYDRGGYEKHCHEVAEGLRCAGHIIHILTSRHGVTAPTSEEFVTRRLGLEADLEHYRPFNFFWQRRSRERQNELVLLKTIAAIEPDLIVLWGMWNLSRRIPALAEMSGIPLLYWLEDWWPLMPDMHTAYWRQSARHWPTRLLMKPLASIALARLRAENYPPPLAFHHTGCGSHFLKRRLAETLPAFRDARVILCGVDLQLFAACQPHQTFNEQGRLKILFLGTLAAHKGVQTAIAALPFLRVARPEIQLTLTLVGDGHPEFEKQLRQQCRKNGVSDSVHFRSAVKKEEIPKILARHDVLVVPSIWEEPFGRVLVEGMAAGVVVVGTASGGSAEILQHEVNGLVFPTEDAHALAQCLLRLIDDPALYARLAKAGKATAPKFDLQRMVDEMEQFFIETIATEKEAAK